MRALVVRDHSIERLFDRILGEVEMLLLRSDEAVSPSRG
jgi:hypothetical protein